MNFVKPAPIDDKTNAPTAPRKRALRVALIGSEFPAEDVEENVPKAPCVAAKRRKFDPFKAVVPDVLAETSSDCDAVHEDVLVTYDRKDIDFVYEEPAIWKTTT